MSKKMKTVFHVGGFVVAVVAFVMLVLAGIQHFRGGQGMSLNDLEMYAYSEDEGILDSVLSEPGYVVGSSEFAPEAAPMSGGSMGEKDKGDGIDRLIIKTGDISMVVEDVRGAVKAISEYATKNGGFVVSSNVNDYDYGVSGNVTVRIPSDVFDKGVEDVKEMGDVTSESIYGEDVTEEYVDLDAQLKNLKAAESQFLEIMKKANKIEDILAVQRELTNVRADIERIEGRMKYLKESARLSTLTVYLSTDPSVLPVVDEGDQWKPVVVVKDALRSLMDVGKGLVNLMIWVVVYIPVWILLILAGWGIVKGVKRIFRR